MQIFKCVLASLRVSPSAPSIHPSVRMSVCLSVCPSVSLSYTMTAKLLKNAKK